MNNTIIFFGTDEFAVTVLDSLHEHNLIPSLIVTTPDTPQGRKLVITPPPVKKWADVHDIPAIQPKELNDKIVLQELSSKKADVFLVASYGKIIPKPILNILPHKTLNIHPSLLPLLRGPAPLETAILQEEQTGVTIMELDEKMDQGPIVLQRTYDGEWPTDYRALRDDLARMGAELFLEALETNPLPQEQDHSKATYTEKVHKHDAEISLRDNPKENYRKILAYSAWPRAFYFEKHNNKQIRVVITEAHLENGELVIDRVIPEGKKEMNYKDFKRGLR